MLSKKAVAPNQSSTSVLPEIANQKQPAKPQDVSPGTNEGILQVKDILKNGPLTLDNLFGMTPQSPFMANNFCYTIFNWEFPEEGEGQCAISEYPLSDDINFVVYWELRLPVRAKTQWVGITNNPDALRVPPSKFEPVSNHTVVIGNHRIQYDTGGRPVLDRNTPLCVYKARQLCVQALPHTSNADFISFLYDVKLRELYVFQSGKLQAKVSGLPEGRLYPFALTSLAVAEEEQRESLFELRRVNLEANWNLKRTQKVEQVSAAAAAAHRVPTYRELTRDEELDKIGEKSLQHAIQTHNRHFGPRRANASSLIRDRLGHNVRLNHSPDMGLHLLGEIKPRQRSPPSLPRYNANRRNRNKKSKSSPRKGRRRASMLMLGNNFESRAYARARMQRFLLRTSERSPNVSVSRDLYLAAGIEERDAEADQSPLESSSAADNRKAVGALSKGAFAGASALNSKQTRLMCRRRVSE